MEVTITVINNLSYPVVWKYFFDSFNGQSKRLTCLQPGERETHTCSTANFREERFNEKYPRTFHFVYSGNWYGPSIEVSKENDGKTFELYSLSSKEDEVHMFACKEINVNI